jgi:hypothetical protein
MIDDGPGGLTHPFALGNVYMDSIVLSLALRDSALQIYQLQTENDEEETERSRACFSLFGVAESDGLVITGSIVTLVSLNHASGG